MKKQTWKDMGIEIKACATRIIKHPLSEELLADVPKALSGADVIVYYYKYGDYDGSGELLYRKDKQWYSVGLGHCSCYGPLDNIGEQTGQNPVDSLDDIKNSYRPIDDYYGYDKHDKIGTSAETSVAEFAKSIGLK